MVYRYSGYYAVKQQNANSEFLSCSENRNGIVFTCVMYCHRLWEQLRSLRVNRERTPVINVKYIAETATFSPKSRIRRIRKYAWACKDLFALLGGRNRNPDIDEGTLGRSVVTKWRHFTRGIWSKGSKKEEKLTFAFVNLRRA